MWKSNINPMSVVEGRSPSPENDVSRGESLSIEETNKIRASLGLKPLGVPVSGASGPPPGSSAAQDLEAVENFARVRQQQKEEAQKVSIQENIARAKDRIKRHEKLKGKTLKDEAPNEGAIEWVKRSRRKERELALKKESELEEQDKLLQQYSLDQLHGLKVGHDVQDFGVGRDTILTLKDANVLQDEEDELVSEQILERERHERNVENKKKKSVYMGYEELDDETGETRLLSKYDEDKHEKGFVLGSEIRAAKESIQEQEPKGKTLISLSYPGVVEEVSDYAPVKFKKSKNPKKRRKRETFEEEEEKVSEDVILPPKPSLEDKSFVDDEDLGARLGERRLAVLKRKRVDSERVFIDDEVEWTDKMDEGGIVIDETSEFVKGLQVSDQEEEEEEEEEKVVEEVKEEVAMETFEKEEEVKAEIMDEPALDKGIGAALNLLRSKGIVGVETPEAADQARRQRARNAWLVTQRARQAQVERERRAQKEAERQSGRFQLMSARERELEAQAENRQREVVAAREQADIYRTYQPQVELEYVDGFGRKLEGKAAFKYFSHQFHGKDSGKAKTARQLQRMADAAKGARLAATDSPSGIGASLAVRQKKTGEAGMRVL